MSARSSVPADKLPPISEQIWNLKYRLKAADSSPRDLTLADTWSRVAKAAASVEKKPGRGAWEGRFFEAMNALEFLPAGRIIAGAGSGRDVTLFNCFVMGRIEDDLGSIFDNLKEAALTMQRGGGIGHDFSTLRPAGALVNSVGAGASGPVSFMDVWDAMCRTIMSAGQRRGAMMATMRCDHPDIETFIDAKADAKRLRNFNLSVLVTDAFMAAVREDRAWALTFEGTIFRTVRARALWNRLMRATYEYAEPGVIFIDRINARNNLRYCEEIHATNPCGEQPLPAHGACLLGSINLARLVERPFEAAAGIPIARLEALAALAVRLLDNVIDVSGYPLQAQKREAKAKRRIGLGVTGLGDALILCGQRYGSDGAARLARTWMAAIETAAYLASAELAREKGAFPLFQMEPFLAAPNVAKLAEPVRRAIAQHGIRNGCLTSIAPTGTISMLAGNVSSGIEPVFDFRYTRRLREDGEAVREESVEDWAHALFRARFGPEAPLPPAFVNAGALLPRDHLEMQAAVQAHVDSSISKTINCPADLPFEAFRDIYAEADQLGLKGCTTFRPNAVTGAVLEAGHDGGPEPAKSTGASPADATPPNGMADVRAHESIGAAIPTPSEPSQHAGNARTALENRAERGDAEAAARVAVRSIAPYGASEAGAVASASGGGKNQRDGSIVYMSPPLEREPVLQGYTYKLKWAQSDHAIYVTINDIEHDGRRRPFEIFINTRNLEHYAWTVALTRMISAVFRRGGDISFVAEELKAVFDPQGGQWMNGRYVPSLLAAIGEIVETHLRRIGWLQPDNETERQAPAQDQHMAVRGENAAYEPMRESEPKGRGRAEAPRLAAAPEQRPTAAAVRLTIGAAAPGLGNRNERSSESHTRSEDGDGGHAIALPGTGAGEDVPIKTRAGPGPVGVARGQLCPRCHLGRFISQSGCRVCTDCGYSQCG